MPLHPQAKKFIDRISAETGGTQRPLGVAEARDSLRALLGGGGRDIAPAKVRELTIPGGDGQAMQARVYQPVSSRELPVLLFLHGGGWIAGDLVSHDPLCRDLMLASGCVIVSIEYRLAPEHKFPAAPRDCYSALQWVVDHGADFGWDSTRVAIGGDSAGGNLAAAVTQLARTERGPQLAFQLLVYPVTDYAFETQSYQQFADGYLLTREAMISHWQHYLSDPDAGRNPLASPLRAESLAGLPPALVITAECDPLRDEGERYAERLRDAGIKVELRRYDGMLHAFFSLGSHFDQGREAVAYAGEVVRRALSS